MKFGLEEYSEIILVSLILIVLLLTIFLISLFVHIIKTSKRTKKLWNGTNKENVETRMVSLLEEMESLRQENREKHTLIEQLRRKQSSQAAKIGVVRYNAFGEAGNDLSYSVAILNEGQDGVVISSIYNRDQSTTFAKPLKEGKSNYTLSTEEMKAIDIAKNQ